MEEMGKNSPHPYHARSYKGLIKKHCGLEGFINSTAKYRRYVWLSVNSYNLKPNQMTVDDCPASHPFTA
jgi:hypothetical protein